MTQTQIFIKAQKNEIENIAKKLDPMFEEMGMTIATFQENKNKWIWSIYVENKKINEIKKIIKKEINNHKIQCQKVPEKNWVKESLKNLKPIKAGRFHIYGTHNTISAKNEKFAVKIDASMAFGTGHHETTSGCLEMMEIYLKQIKQEKISKACDMGTGTGILAIALAKCGKWNILACDNDAKAVEIAKENVKINKVEKKIKIIKANGFNHPCFEKFGESQLIIANILEKPLKIMAKDMIQKLEKNGYAILSGILHTQKDSIVQAYTQQGFHLEQSLRKKEWMTLMMKKER